MRHLKSTFKSLKKTRGNAWVGILVLLVLMSALGIALVSDTVRTIAQSKKAEQIVVAQALTDAGIDKAIWKLNKTAGYVGENDIVLPTGTVDIAITTIDAENKQVIATAYVPSKQNPKTTRKVRANLSAAPDQEGIAFRYGIQVGTNGVTLGNGTTIVGNVYSNSFVVGAGVTKSTITGDAYAVTTVTDVKVNGQTKINQPPSPLPTFDTNFWKNQANQNNDPIDTSFSKTGGHFGPRQVNGDLNLNGVTIDGPIYVTGNLTIGGAMAINNNFGSHGTVVLVDGTISVSTNTTIAATTASPKGYVLFASNSNAATAITLGTFVTGGVFFALNGTIQTQPHVNPVSLVGKGLDMQPNGDLHYDSGLALADFSDGPGGSWVLKEWQIIH